MTEDGLRPSYTTLIHLCVSWKQTKAITNNGILHVHKISILTGKCIVSPTTCTCRLCTFVTQQSRLLFYCAYPITCARVITDCCLTYLTEGTTVSILTHARSGHVPDGVMSTHWRYRLQQTRCDTLWLVHGRV